MQNEDIAIPDTSREGNMAEICGRSKSHLQRNFSFVQKVCKNRPEIAMVPQTQVHQFAWFALDEAPAMRTHYNDESRNCRPRECVLRKKDLLYQ